MFRPTQALCRKYRKLPLTTKDVNKGFYKGTRTGRMGSHTQYGGYIVDLNLVRTFVVPDLTDFKLTPFVTRNARATSGAGMYREFEHGPKDARFYLEEWKNNNGKY